MPNDIEIIEELNSLYLEALSNMTDNLYESLDAFLVEWLGNKEYARYTILAAMLEKLRYAQRTQE